MKKITTMLLFVATIFLISGHSVFAHTHLDTSNPEDGSTVTESIETIEIYFDTVIEESAAVEVENNEGETFPTNDISISDNEMIVTLEEPLENGSYTITWDIIGVDGHPMQESISFDVDAEEIVEEEEVQEEAEEQPATEEDETSENTEATPDTETSDETPQDTDESSNAVLIAILLVGIIAVIAIVLLRRKK